MEQATLTIACVSLALSIPLAFWFGWNAGARERERLMDRIMALTAPDKLAAYKYHEVADERQPIEFPTPRREPDLPQPPPKPDNVRLADARISFQELME